MAMTDAISNAIHSRVVTTVVDNSIVEETNDVSISFVLFQPYFSAEGLDGKVKSWDRETDFVKAAGNPNFEKYGQQIYNGTQWLKGGGRLLGLRLTAEDALPSFGAINIRTRKTFVPVEYQTDDSGRITAISKYVEALAISPVFQEVPKEILTPAVMTLSESVQMKTIASTMRGAKYTNGTSKENEFIIADLLQNVRSALNSWVGTDPVFDENTSSYSGTPNEGSPLDLSNKSKEALKEAISAASPALYHNAADVTDQVLQDFNDDNMASLYTLWSGLTFDGEGNPARNKTYRAILELLKLDTFGDSTAETPDPLIAAIIDAYADWKSGPKSDGTSVNTVAATYYVSAKAQNAYLDAKRAYDTAKKSPWEDHILSVFKIRGKGKYGDSYSIALQLNQADEEDVESSRRWYFNVSKLSDTGNSNLVSNTYSVSFNDMAEDSSGTVSEFIDTVVASKQFMSKFDQLACYTNAKVYNDLVDLFGNYCDAVYDSEGELWCDKEDKNFIDFFTLIDQKGKAYKRFIPASAVDVANMINAGDPEETDFVNGAYLMNGDDGSLDPNRYVIGTRPIGYTGTNKYYATEKERDAAIQAVKTDLLVKAYAGEVDANILSPYKYQISAVIDAGNDPVVKKQMIYLIRARLDIVAYIDCGAVASATAAMNYRANIMNGFTDWNASLWGQSAVAYDAYNKKNIDVTYLYDVAYKLPYLRKNVGPNRLMAGTKKGAVETVSSINWIPTEEEKTELLKSQINYVEEVRLDQFAIMSVRTMYYYRKSYLAVIRNVHAICEAIYIGRQILTDLRFEDDPNVAMTLAREQMTRNMNYLITNGPVERMTILVEQSSTEAIDNEASATIEMKFKDFIQTWKFNIVATR